MKVLKTSISALLISSVLMSPAFANDSEGIIASQHSTVVGDLDESQKHEVEAIISSGMKEKWTDHQFNQALSKYGMKKEPMIAPYKTNVGIESLRGQVYMPAPTTFTYDSGRKRVITGQMTWYSDSTGKPYWAYDKSIAGNMGGEDEIGLYLSNGAKDNIRVFDSSMKSEDRCGSVYYHGGSPYTRHHESDTGVLHKAQDTVINRIGSGCGYTWNNVDYNFDTAWVYMYMEKRNTTQKVDVDVRTQFAHTWSTTVINSFSFGLDSFGFGYSNPSYGWDTVSVPYRLIW
ncbi:hypothetical protein EV586_103150 [Tumebacillus sp. BK434]|uniref:hypothetical protein n=1 Tax=Tumebacillus sp. BK434 TaxID=2512169 RepID=UPI001049082B|nr:hypothetical protein [Tumebacillus sp. BK434]TCP55498.1 hypothetical protein EV586_103150 [Tumebacillus sp. BK434]